MPSGNGRSALVGLSGGVDSAVAAHVLRAAGWEVVGITLRLWRERQGQETRGASVPDGERRAEAVARYIGIPHLVLDAEEEFRRTVVDYFVSEYRRGRTPNPCCKCNSRFRFSLLVEVARSLGMEKVATGHYARLVGEPLSLARGVDSAKDQSYVLAEVPPSVLASFVFPLGDWSKAKVKAYADEVGLTRLTGARESQEICFIPDNDYRRFLRARLGELPGEIVSGEGEGTLVLGMHKGTYNFTVGQRRGVGVAGGRPLYVVAVDADARRVVLGTRSETAVGEVLVEDVMWHRDPSAEHLRVQLRSSGPSFRAVLATADATSFTVRLEEPACGVAPGQTAVLYENDMVCAGGTIAETRKWPGSLSGATMPGSK